MTQAMNRNLYIDRLSSIESMLLVGHNSIKLERHTLALWTVTAGVLIGFTGLFMELVLPEAVLANHQQKQLAVEVFVSLFLMMAIALELRLTKRNREKRDESVSPLQKKLTRIIWMIFLTSVLLLVFGNNRIGFGQAVFGIYIVLAGLVLYILGLFSRPWLRVSGILKILLGITALFLLHGKAMHIFTTCAFLIGGLLIAYFDTRATTRNQIACYSLVWIAAVMLGYGAATHLYQAAYIDADGLPLLSLEEYKKTSPLPHRYIVRLGKGTQIPVRYSLQFDLFTKIGEAQWTVKLASDVDVVMDNDELTGIYRIGDGPWRSRRESLYVVKHKRAFIIDQAAAVPVIKRNILLAADKPIWRPF